MPHRHSLTSQVAAYTGPDQLAACLKGAELVVIPAGVPRKPGMTRDDLFNVNAGIVKALVEAVAKNSPSVRTFSRPLRPAGTPRRHTSHPHARPASPAAPPPAAHPELLCHAGDHRDRDQPRELYCAHRG
ncbi:MAG: lactate/malate family dehydrogenase [Brevundimonas sp.]|uniref:lactate/malate family dehydrogenase n=1 Tax=Brevundimonas sp. TaxID=1871086 RepID=UPI004034BC95